MKGRIIVVNKQDKLHFYWIGKGIGKLYLFSQKFSKSVFDFFCKGRSAKEVLSFKQWNRSPGLDKTITKLPIYMRYSWKESTGAYASIA